jgi:hypothetical protein
MVVAHVAFWRQALTLAQIAGFGAYATSWPQNQAFQTGGGSGGTVTIGSPQDAQLNDIQSKVGDIPGIVDAVNYISSTVNTIKGTTDTILANVNSGFSQVADWLNGLVADVTSTVTTAAGNVSRTVGQMLSGREGDTLTEFDFGTTCDSTPATYELGGGKFYQAQFIVTSMPDWYVKTGPGDTYITQSLGTLEFHRGGALEKRIGLHTTTHLEAPLPGLGDAPIIGEFGVTPGDYQIVVYPAPGICINTKAYHLP